MPQKSTEHYRPDIDGLRALAIIPVLLFHAKLGCPGGFVGVDIFFVISGYLISSLILREVNAGTFSLIAFWERRIRRILPALVVVVLATFAVGWFLFLPEAFEALGKSAVAQGTLISNLYFYREWLSGTGYFKPALDPQPLLHTWSLAVEEQFYLFFPLLLTCLPRNRRPPLAGSIVSLAVGWLMLSLYSYGYYPAANFYLSAQTWKFLFQIFFLLFLPFLLMFLIRFRRPSFVETVASLAVASLALSIYGSCYYPAAAFYLLPARAWELLLGVLLVLLRGRFLVNGRAREIAGWLGFCLIGCVVFFYHAPATFPIGAAIPPCLGAALIIFSSESKLSGVGRFLAWRPLVFIGLISYSLYLWHWPLLVFSEYPFSYESPIWRVAMLLTAFALAALSWKYVETPFRKGPLLRHRRHLFCAAAVSIATLLAFAIFVVHTSGVRSRFSDHTLALLDERDHFAFRDPVSLPDALAGQFPEIGSHDSNQPVRLLIWGDSHAMAVTPVLDELCRKYSWRGIRAVQHADAASPSLFFLNSPPSGPHQPILPTFAEAVLDYIAKNHVQNVVIAGFWIEYPESTGIKSNLVSIVRAAMKLNARVYVLSDVPQQNPDFNAQVIDVVLHDGDLDRIGITPEQNQENQRGMEPTLEQISQLGATVLNPSDYFLNRHGLYGVVKNGRLMYADYQHLNIEGSELLTPLFEPIFKAN